MSDTSYAGFAGPPEGDELNNLLFLVQQQIARLRTTQLVKVLESYPGDNSKNPTTIDMQPVVDQVDTNGNRTAHDVVYGVVASRWHGGRNALLIDPVAGDVGVIHTADRDISQVVANNGEPSAPGSGRRHDFSDSVYIGTVWTPQPTNYTDLRHGNHTTSTDGNVSHTTVASGGSHTTTSEASNSPHVHTTQGENSSISHTTQASNSLMSFLTQGKTSPISHGTQSDSSPISHSTQGKDSPISHSTTADNSPITISTSGRNSPITLSAPGEGSGIGLPSGSISGGSLSSGAAAQNVGTLGGDLSGSLPNPSVVGITNVLNANTLPVFASNALALAGGLSAGRLYINNTVSGSEHVLCVVH